MSMLPNLPERIKHPVMTAVAVVLLTLAAVVPVASQADPERDTRIPKPHKDQDTAMLPGATLSARYEGGKVIVTPHFSFVRDGLTVTQDEMLRDRDKAVTSPYWQRFIAIGYNGGFLSWEPSQVVDGSIVIEGMPEGHGYDQPPVERDGSAVLQFYLVHEWPPYGSTVADWPPYDGRPVNSRAVGPVVEVLVPLPAGSGTSVAPPAPPVESPPTETPAEDAAVATGDIYALDGKGGRIPLVKRATLSMKAEWSEDRTVAWIQPVCKLDLASGTSILADKLLADGAIVFRSGKYTVRLRMATDGNAFNWNTSWVDGPRLGLPASLLFDDDGVANIGYTYTVNDGSASGSIGRRAGATATLRIKPDKPLSAKRDAEKRDAERADRGMTLFKDPAKGSVVETGAELTMTAIETLDRIKAAFESGGMDAMLALADGSEEEAERLAELAAGGDPKRMRDSLLRLSAKLSGVVADQIADKLGISAGGTIGEYVDAALLTPQEKAEKDEQALITTYGWTLARARAYLALNPFALETAYRDASATVKNLTPPAFTGITDTVTGVLDTLAELRINSFASWSEKAYKHTRAVMFEAVKGGASWEDAIARVKQEYEDGVADMTVNERDNMKKPEELIGLWGDPNADKCRQGPGFIDALAAMMEEEGVRDRWDTILRKGGK